MVLCVHVDDLISRGPEDRLLELHRNIANHFDLNSKIMGQADHLDKVG